MQSVREIMSNNQITISLEQSIQRAAVLMKEHDIGFLPVVRHDKLLGVITDRDIVIRAIAANIDVQQSIERIYSKDVISCHPDTSVEQVAQLMANHQIHRILVTEHERLLGVVALADLSREVSGQPVAGKALSGISNR